MVKAFTIKPEELEVHKIKYETWKTFDKSILSSTDDVFTVELSSRFGEAYVDFDLENEREIISDYSEVDGVFMNGQLIGLISSNHTKMGGEDVTLIGFILIHPLQQKRGIGTLLVRKIVEESHSSYVAMYPCSHGSKVICTRLGFTDEADISIHKDFWVYKKSVKV